MLRHYEDAGLTSRIARFASEAQFSDLPENIRDYTKVLIADCLACGFGASVLPGARNFVSVPQAWGGPEQAVILTTGAKVSSAAAAFANAYLVNALDADDTFYTTCHPLAPIFAAALAAAEEVGASGRELITAIAAGYDVAIRCKRSMVGGGHGSMGWFVMGAAAAAARLYRLDPLQTAMAFGTAAFGAPHTNARWNQMGPGRRHDMKYWATHFTAFAAITAAQLSRAGVTSDRVIFDGEPNYSHFIGTSGVDEALMFEDLGERWWIGETSIKPWSVCRYSQITITLLKQIIAEQKLRPEEIDAVEIQTWDFIASPWFTDRIEITSEYDAQFSFPHAVAATILGWDMGTRWQQRAIGNAELAAIADKVHVSTNPRYEEDSIITSEGNRYMATVVTVRARGEAFTREGGTALGDPFEDRYRMDMAKIREKFFGFAGETLSEERMEAVFENVASLENLDKVTFQLSC